MNDVLKKISEVGILPVVVLDDAKDAKDLAKALIEGGLPCAEVTFRTAAAEKSIRVISEAYPEMLVGAGTVLSVDQVKKAVAAGAKFIVSPGFDEEVVKYCLDNNISVTPGVCTPSDVQKGYKMGLDVLKFFPAEPSGGLSMIKAIAAPYTMMKFIPTGGINENNMEDYLKYDRILAIGGSWMVKSSLVKNGEFEKIKEMSKTAVARVKEIRG
ncbi:MAG: bifunctional 4-hydroxy-2-oxoglutarate aldolase/2-dehydro-3-deoxy-phosphogluconate aldolase [Erysipelotrichaceae bacterium]|nr:bifunctional 4-hydroxy-2-oxoglutarate aldolase/2-dehydro-3-deoxy-phosphogluconate aldolase [Erysipelotrichaceae bacterium]NLW51735.1 bifunctional 4-hydroxy-2-oxoglutarate aldolase/2-dehydro-3-deoxy-phosphogluconate aldolase [Tissierellia bacterium]